MAGLRGRVGRGETVDTKVPDNVGGRKTKGDLFALGHRHNIYYSICESYSLFQELESGKRLDMLIL